MRRSASVSLASSLRMRSAAPRASSACLRDRLARERDARDVSHQSLDRADVHANRRVVRVFAGSHRSALRWNGALSLSAASQRSKRRRGIIEQRAEHAAPTCELLQRRFRGIAIRRSLQTIFEPVTEPARELVAHGARRAFDRVNVTICGRCRFDRIAPAIRAPRRCRADDPTAPTHIAREARRRGA